MRNVQTIPNFIITFAPKHFTDMKMRNILMLLFVWFAVSANSQTRSRKVHPVEVAHNELRTFNLCRRHNSYAAHQYRKNNFLHLVKIFI